MFWALCFTTVTFLSFLNYSETKPFKEDFFADFLSTRLGVYQISVFMPYNVSIEWAMDVFTKRNHNQIAFNIMRATKSSPSEAQPTFEKVFILDGTKQAFLFIPQTIPEVEFYLRMALNWAYRAPRIDDRLNKVVMFFLLHGLQSIKEVSYLLQILTLKYAVGISNTQYLYPTAMDGFYIINGTDLKSNFFEIYTFGRRDSTVFHLKHIPFDKLGLFTVRRNNFQGATLAVAIVKRSIDRDVTTKLDVETNQTKITGGMSFDIMDCLQRILNFSMQVTMYEKGWNENLDNVTHQDMGLVLFQEIEDILVIKTTYIVKLARDFKLLVPHHIQNLYAFFIQPSFGFGTNIFWHLFKPICWGFLCGVLLFIWGSKFLIKKIMNNLEGLAQSVEQIPAIITDEIIWLVALVTQQGWTQSASAGPMKFLFFTASFSVLICLTALTAQLTSKLSVSTAPIKSFLELIRTNILIAVDKDSTVARDTVMGDRGDFRFDEKNTEILKRNRDRYCDMLEGAKLVMAGTHTYLGYGEVKSILISKFNRTGEDFCAISGVSALPVHNLPFRSGMIATQNFPYKEFFNVKLTLLLQSGLASRFNRHFEKEYSNVDCHYFEDGGKLMEWHDLLFLYEALLIGILVSLILSCFEKLFHRRSEMLISNVVPVYS
ncbi:unnamed protein product [Allacma fusca]|uniref:Uncharacterized protein n=1 Tax=Allacma fusca TaxID=39272 RepID=A0A8J2JYW0_9HEXA|nr:unnamed protein product [Allacma fusca]